MPSTAALLEQLLTSAQSQLHEALMSNFKRDPQAVTALISDAQRLINYARHQLEQSNG